MARYAARTDSTHKQIVQALRKVGCKVSDTSRVGCGFPDLVVRVQGGWQFLREPEGTFQCHVPTRVLLMEVKTARGKLTEDQERFIADWPETVVVRSVDEALMAVGISQ